jgi:prefoldin subunit 5
LQKRLRVDDSETESNKKKMRMDAAPAATDAAAAAAATDVPLQDFDADKLNLIMKGDATDAKKALSALTSEVKELARARDQARANLDKVEAEIVTKQKEADALRVVFESADSVAREGETAIAVLQQQFDECARTFSEAQRKLDLVVNQIDDQLARLRKPSSSS